MKYLSLDKYGYYKFDLYMMWKKANIKNSSHCVLDLDKISSALAVVKVLTSP